jgi:8-oxo-dGTP pyrophosphatase MutT (NUDIX family)
MTLLDEIKEIIDASLCPEEDIYPRFIERFEERNLTRDENPQSHFCLYFLPYNLEEKEIFFVHHKKSGLWLSPGGHIEKGESLLDTLEREVREELGVKNAFQNNIKPSMLSITSIENKIQPCREHLDIWYFLAMDGKEFNIDMGEFHETRWLNVAEARKIVTNQPNLRAIDRIEKLF